MRTALARLGFFMFGAAALLSIAEAVSLPTEASLDGDGEENGEPDDSPHHSLSNLAHNADAFVVPMRRVGLRGKGKCMDGSKPLFYIRTNNASKKWILYLQGGSFCFDQQSCHSRKVNNPGLVSSNHMPSTWTATGILSSNPEDNPLLFFANAVFLPYCSGDVWSGNVSRRNRDGNFFMGSAILQETILYLIQNEGLRNARKLFLAGGSAGAIGVLLNVDRVASLIRSQGLLDVAVYGIVDSGWFFEPELTKRQKQHVPCNNVMTCPPAVTVQKGYRYWNARLPKACVERHRREPWLCFFGPRVYPHIRSPVFILQYLHDIAQEMAISGLEGVANSGSPNLGNRSPLSAAVNTSLVTKNSLKNVTAVFAMSCRDHEALIYSQWHKLRIGEKYLVDAIRCWEESQEVTNRASSRSRMRDAGIHQLESNRQSQEERVEVGRNVTSAPLFVYETARSGRTTTGRDSDTELVQMAASNRLVSSQRKHRVDECSYRIIDTCLASGCNPFCPLNTPLAR